MKSRYLILAAVGLIGCGVGSVSPIVTDAESAYDSRLLGTWLSPDGKDSAVVTAGRANGYDVVFTEKDGKAGRFSGRLGRLGRYRVLDLQPDDVLPTASDTYKSLLLRAHGAIVVDSIGDVVAFRLVGADSLKAYLKARPQSVAHTLVGNSVLLTASSSEVHRFFTGFFSRPGVLSEREVMRRRVP